MPKLIFVTGKGGVGKSALTAALASALSEDGLPPVRPRVCVVELEETRMSDFFGLSPIDYAGKKTSTKISLLNLNAKDCFEEYAARFIPKAALIFIKNRWVHHFIDATPGLKEILILGKIASLLEENAADFLIVDAPATGHTISLLQAPRIALGALRHGPLKATVEKILNTLEGDNPIHFVLVTRLENFIVHETLELYEHLSQSFPASPLTLWVHGQQDFINIPSPLLSDLPKLAEPLLQLLKETEAKRERQEKLFAQIQKEIKDPIAQTKWIDNVEKETDLRKILSKELKPNLWKHFSKRNA